MKFAGVIEPGVASGVVTRASYVQGSYIVVESIEARDALAEGVVVVGTPVYISDLQKTQRWNGTEWVDESKGTIAGYYYNGNFYADAEHTIVLDALENQIYIDKTEDLTYFYNGSTYVSLTTDLTEIEDRLIALELGKQDKITSENKLSKDLVSGLEVYSLVTETGSKIELVLNNTTYKLKSILRDKNNNIVFESNEVDLPIEEVVKDGWYDDSRKAIILELVDGTEIVVPVGDLVSGLQEKIDEDNKLPAEYIDGLKNGSFGISYIDSLEWVADTSIEYKSEETATDLATLISYVNSRWGITTASTSSILFAYNAGAEYNTAETCQIKQVDDKYYISIEEVESIYNLFIYADTNRIYRIKSSKIAIDQGVKFLQEVSASIEIGDNAGQAYEGSKGARDAADIATLKGYFAGDSANKAVADSSGNVFETTYATKDELANKQDVLTAGANVTIDANNVISVNIPAITVDTELDPDSENAVENKAIYAGLATQKTELLAEIAKKQEKIDADHKLNASYVSGLANVATSGDYNDLQNKPVIPEGVIVDDSLSIVSTNPVQNRVITLKLTTKQDVINGSNKLSAEFVSGLADVAKTGRFSDLINVPKATKENAGLMIVGDHLKVNEDGKVDVDVEEITGGFITKTEADGYYLSIGATVADLPIKDGISSTDLKNALALNNVANVGTTNTVTVGNNNNVTSGGVANALSPINTQITNLGTNKQDKLVAGAGISINENNVISATSGVSFRVVQELPETGESNVIYLKPVEEAQESDIYAEYLWIENKWEKIGTTQTSIDGYVPVTRTIAGVTLETNISAAALKEALAITKADIGLSNVTNVATTITLAPGDDRNITSGAVYTALSNKQDKLPTTAKAGQILTSTSTPGIVEWKDKEIAEKATVTTLEKEYYTESDALYLATILNPKAEDIAVIKAPISTDRWEYTAYVYYNSNWVAMDGNYNSDNIYFSRDFTYTADIGVKKVPASGSGTIDATGKNLSQVLSSLFAEEKKGSITQPSVSIQLAGSGSFEVGTTINNPGYTSTFSAGSYQYGPPTGVTVSSWAVNDTDGHSSTTPNGSFESFVVGDNTTYSISVTATYGDGVWAKTNMGNQPETGDLAQRIVAGSKSSTSGTIHGFRKSFWYVGTDTTSGTTSALIRAYPNTYNGVKTSYSLSIADGTKRVTIAVPGNHTLTSVIDVDGMGLDVKDNFTKTTVQVEGANGYTATAYSVFEFINPNGVTQTTYNVSMN